MTPYQWIGAGIVASAVDIWTVRRRLSGKMGERNRLECLAAVNRVGGLRNLILLGLALDFLLPPIAIAGCLVAYARKRD